ncbi:MAG: hypothetical protein RMK29_04185 [Myxococcales bacterium]|nr:hypothetical protein [Myxococcota bacterium]MDW8280886.1 hypothetical protein [Myxococcales bacterium]
MSLVTFRQTVRGATTAFLTAEEAAVSSKIEPSGQWRLHTLLLAEQGAAMLRAAPELFSFSFTAEQVLQERERIGELEEAAQTAREQAGRLERALTLHKNRLADWTAQMEQSARARLTDPGGRGELQARVRDAAGAMLKMAERFQEGPVAARKATMELRHRAEQAQQEAERARLERKLLRGEPVTLEELRPAPKQKSRPGRRTRR